MAGDFVARITDLMDAVGSGNLEGRVEFDQVYAHYQHEGLDFKHPQGGEAEYLRKPALANVNSSMRKIAERAITAEGSDIEGAMIDVTEDLAKEASRRAPIEFGPLRGSDHPTVLSDGEVIYDRPPETPRLSEEEPKRLHQHPSQGSV